MKIVLVFFALLSSSDSYSFAILSEGGKVFKTGTISLDYDSSSCDGAFTEDEIRELLQGAADETWNRVPYSKIDLYVGEDRTSAREDGILMSCDSAWTNENAGGQGGPNSYQDGHIHTGAFTLNTNSDLSNNVQGRGKEAQRKLTAHEIGHSLGLGHSAFDRALMNAKRNPNDGLTEDDIAGITYLYPLEDEGIIGGCGSVSSGGGPLSGFAQWFALIVIMFMIQSKRLVYSRRIRGLG